MQAVTEFLRRGGSIIHKRANQPEILLRVTTTDGIRHQATPIRLVNDGQDEQRLVLGIERFARQLSGWTCGICQSLTCPSVCAPPVAPLALESVAQEVFNG
jgi:hypothetical protein